MGIARKYARQSCWRNIIFEQIQILAAVVCVNYYLFSVGYMYLDIEISGRSGMGGISAWTCFSTNIVCTLFTISEFWVLLIDNAVWHVFLDLYSCT